jgi:amino acid transporter
VKSRGDVLGFWAVTAIGVGGMVGGGIFAVLGLAVQLAHGGTPVAFLVAGVVALLTSSSYARLSVAYPSRGGTVEFLNQAFGVGVLTGALNILLWISYVVMLSLYAHAFGSYGAGFFPASAQPLTRHLLLSGSIVLLTGLNALGSRAVGEAEEWIVGFKVAILALFVGVGLWGGDYGRVLPSTWAPWPALVAGGMMIFLAYEGFELIANSARDVRRPEATLPRAYYASVLFVLVLYILVSLVTVINLPVARIVAARDFALAESARPFLGAFGFTLIAVAALLSTASAINATLYGTARVSYVIAKDGELPALLERKIWRRPLEGLLLTSAFALLVANLFDLSSISVMGSAGFLLIFAAVNAANLRLRRRTGGSRWLSGAGFVACLAALGALIAQRMKANPREIWTLGVMIGLSLAAEAAYRAATGRTLRPSVDRGQRDGAAPGGP